MMKHLDLAIFGAEPAFAEKRYVGPTKYRRRGKVHRARVREIFAAAG
jgi:hypothetical protein